MRPLRIESPYRGPINMMSRRLGISHHGWMQPTAGNCNNKVQLVQPCTRPTLRASKIVAKPVPVVHSPLPSPQITLSSSITSPKLHQHGSSLSLNHAHNCGMRRAVMAWAGHTSTPTGLPDAARFALLQRVPLAGGQLDVVHWERGNRMIRVWTPPGR